MTKALIRLRVCAGWSALLLFTSIKVEVSRIEAHNDDEARASWPPPGYVPIHSV